MNSRRLDPKAYGEVFEQKEVFICASEKMRRIKEIINQVASSDDTILIQGETGVGKGVIARVIYQHSSRKAAPFVTVHCAAFPEELLDIEMFGYEEGASRGAHWHKPGRFELAHHGTVFLDEVSEIPLSLQFKFLQVLQDRTVLRIGAKKETCVDVRILGATNQNMDAAVRNGSFREDLYLCLNGVNITIPPLRDRKEEIPVYVDYFLTKYQIKYNVQLDPIPDPIMKVLIDHRWSGNVRELETAIKRFVVLRGRVVLSEDLFVQGTLFDDSYLRHKPEESLFS
jgi:two-component system, NtrC family, response regulator AtoC